MWHLGLNNNNITYSLSREIISNEINVIYVTDNSEHETFYLISPHFGDLPEEKYEEAYFKALSFVRLINGCLLLTGDHLLYADKYLTYFNGAYSSMKKGGYVSERSLLEYEQFVNPFTNIQVKDIEGKTYIANCLIMVKREPIVRRVIGLLYLFNRDNLYLLVNAYKIYEIILSDLNITKNGNSYKEIRSNLSTELIPYLDYFILGDFTYYSNSIVGSTGEDAAGLFSRHGASKSVYNKNPLDLKELNINLRNLINVWLHKKIKEFNGKIFKTYYQPRDIKGNEDLTSKFTLRREQKF